ncbi:PREDICTED: homeobox protein Hox-B3-like [Camelina sativa]|uniref:Homeobox protein Hox-B3-like n=1 Tax=Camelina sativa TaxID=90675 RepID=A0ABM0Z7S4_CAMSA|nr:PREDICTED: homeobox protein Hox-B3-like [Camelina sativa]
MDDTISNPSMEPLLFSIDTMSRTQQKLKLLVDNGDYGFERGPRYGEYARLRESKLQMKRDFEKILKEEQVRFGFREEDEIRVLPEKKTTRFGFNPSLNQRKAATTSSSSLAQSVPDFSAMIRKENRRPVNSNLLPRRTELTPPPVKSRNAAVFAGSALRGSVSASAGEKKGIGMMMRKSYATVEDLKKVSMAAASAINGGGGGGGGGGRKSIGGGGRKSIGGGRTILGYRQIY